MTTQPDKYQTDAIAYLAENPVALIEVLQTAIIALADTRDEMPETVLEDLRSRVAAEGVFPACAAIVREVDGYDLPAPVPAMQDA